ncbi:Glycosyltransferase type 1 [Halomicronema hongdechloris C2206]|uniref:Glycosyltransferase type 1 n=1 Tax=Halomicronema hongdechloris C2206 TaxID=1641165 RepID=A0A1Z3HLZ8_9CYAN|nr:glycosyltransferase family 4 protein [Halomicronema hongdechloris]ASC71324.1 Glycosyltransferase type 1 [Halomicronema hongdechloris C2206]
MRILISAYACRPNIGSEPAIGWNLSKQLAENWDIWVITRQNNQPEITKYLEHNQQVKLNVIYCDLPRWFQYFNKNQRLVHLHYYLWQIVAYFLGRRLHKKLNFSLVHHITYVRYWSPSFLALLPIPFIWGPVGGGEATPQCLLKDLNPRELLQELSRFLIHRLSEWDPFLGLTAKRSQIALATTEDTARRLAKLGAKNIKVLSQLGLEDSEIDRLSRIKPSQKCRFISIGRLLHWKGFHLSLQAFAAANLPLTIDYWVIGDGPDYARLTELAEDLNIADRVHFMGKLSREETLSKLQEASVLVHPSLHDSGALVCAEAMAAGRPVICLDLGGPALQVTQDTGIKIPAQSAEKIVQSLSEAMVYLAKHPDICAQMGIASQQRVRNTLSWSIKAKEISTIYDDCAVVQS